MKYPLKSFVIFVCLVLGLFACVHRSVEPDQATSNFVREPSAVTDSIEIVDLNVHSGESAHYTLFDLRRDLIHFETHVEILLEQSDLEKKLEPKKDKPLTMQEAIQFSAVDKGYRVGLQNILKQISIAKNSENVDQKNQALYKIKLITQSLKNKYKTPIKTRFEAALIPIYILSYNYNAAIDKDLTGPDSTQNPENSLLWTNQISQISKPNLFSYRYTAIGDQICDYEKAKSGWGVHPGFHVSCGEVSYKLKFGNELYSGPFNSRIYQLLGYRSPEINYVDSVKVKYSRKMFLEYNSRKSTEYSLLVLGLKVGSLTKKTTYNLFDEVEEFVLIDGQHVKTDEFKKKLLNSTSSLGEFKDSDFNENIEKTVSYVLFKHGTITTKTDDVEIGPWRVDDLDFTQKREFRGLLILSGWLGNFDIRMDNNRLLELDKASEDERLKLALVDVGSGMGNSNSILFKSSSVINDMPWTVTQTNQDRLQMVGYLTLELNKTFEQVKLADAQWMLRQICLIKPEQINQALVATGMSSAAVKLAGAKLLNRRNQMIQDFEMQSELQNSCFTSVDKKMNYDPLQEGLVEVFGLDAKKVQAPDLGEIVKNGQLVKR